MKLTETQITSILYQKEGEETSARVILPVSVPSTTIRAIDLSDVPPTEREELVVLLKEYNEYKKTFMATMFNFETWVGHTAGVTITPKWRSFKPSGLR